MKKLLLIICAFTISSCAMAQSFITGSRIKMSDAIAYYEQYIKPFRSHESAETDVFKKGVHNSKFQEKLETKDYQFDRWRWYWQQHMDGNGYLISPAQTFNSWMTYKNQHASSRTTSGSASSGANWTFQGPDSSGADGAGVGRLNVVAFHPTDSNTYWVGSPGGGAWKTTDNGTTWTSMTDQLPLLSMTDIVFNPQNPNTIYLCTGDRDGEDYYSIGILKSYDGGTTWNTTGISWPEYQFHEANSLLINPSDTNSLIFASDSAIYRSFNGGATWTVVQTGYFMQLLYHPTDTNIVYATTQYNYTSGAQSQIYRSADGGMTWTQVTSLTDAERIALAVTPDSVQIVEAVIAASESDPTGNVDGLQGIWKSEDTGHTFRQIFTPANCSSGSQNLLSENQDGTGCNGQGWYDLCIAISPTNASDVYVGGVNAWKSTNGGASWSLMNQWDGEVRHVAVIHADKHCMAFNPLTPTRFFECNDGGIYYSYNASATSTWVDATNGLGITEFYRLAVANAANYVLGGAQDVGSKYIENFVFQDADGGDGMECHIDPDDTNIFYTGIYYGEIDWQDISTGGYNTISNNIPGTPSGGWTSPYILEPSCGSCILAGYQDVYRSANQGTSWTDISGPLCPSSDMYRVVTTLADSNTIYASEQYTDTFYYTHNMGSTAWTTATVPAPYTGQQISDILIDPRNANNLWFAFSGYVVGGSPQILNYNAATNTWTPFNTNLPDVPINCITIDTQNRTLYVGTEVGVFYMDSTMTEWEAYTSGMPVVSVTDLQLNYATNKIWASTFGRSMWASVRHSPPTGIATVKAAPKNIVVYPNPSHGSFMVSINNGMNDKSTTMQILDNLGNVVWHGSADLSVSPMVRINAPGLAPGNYILEMNGATVGSIGKEKIAIY